MMCLTVVVTNAVLADGAMQGITQQVSYGSLADTCERIMDVRFTP